MTKMYLSERNFDFLRGWKRVGEKGGDPGFRSEISLEIAIIWARLRANKKRFYYLTGGCLFSLSNRGF